MQIMLICACSVHLRLLVPVLQFLIFLGGHSHHLPELLVKMFIGTVAAQLRYHPQFIVRALDQPLGPIDPCLPQKFRERLSERTVQNPLQIPHAHMNLIRQIIDRKLIPAVHIDIVQNLLCQYVSGNIAVPVVLLRLPKRKLRQLSGKKFNQIP